MTIQRSECKLTIARQIATNEGRVWARLSLKMQTQYLVLAENILATVERMSTGKVWR
jgi:hypothetical protein